MSQRQNQSSPTRARNYRYNLTGGHTRSGAVRGGNRGEMALIRQRAGLSQSRNFHAVQSPPPGYNDVLPHTVTVQWLTGVTEGSPGLAGQESVPGSKDGDNGTQIGLGIRHVSNSRFEYALSANPTADFLGDRTPVGLGIRQIPNSRFEYALSANPSADFLGDRNPIGLGIRHLSNSKFECAVSTNPSSEFIGGGEMLGLPIVPEEGANANCVTIKSPGPVLHASPSLSIKKASPRQTQNSAATPSHQIPAQNVAYFTERHALSMPDKKNCNKDWFATRDEDSSLPSPMPTVENPPPTATRRYSTPRLDQKKTL